MGRQESPNRIGLDNNTLQGINISPKKGIFEDDFPFPQVGYVNFLEGIFFLPLSEVEHGRI